MKCKRCWRQSTGSSCGTPPGPGSAAAVEAFATMLGVKALKPLSPRIPTDKRRSFDPGERQKRQVKALEDFTQGLLRESEHTRNRFFLYKVAPELADET